MNLVGISAIWNLLRQPLVEVSRQEIGPWETFYFAFNAIEAGAWLIFAILVLRRWFRFRHSRLEIVYSLLFVLFGISDIIEIVTYPVWLLIFKGIVLGGLLVVRRKITTRYYPDRWY